MGQRHIANVYEIPAGWVTDRQLLLLIALAEGTADDRAKWLHDRGVLAERLNWSPSKLRRELSELEEAKMITRQRRGHRLWIDIGHLEHIAVPGPGDHITPTLGATRAAARVAQAQANLRRGESP